MPAPAPSPSRRSDPAGKTPPRFRPSLPASGGRRVPLAILGVAGLTAALAALAGCGDGAEPTTSSELAVIGECTRDEVVLRGDLPTCAADIDCPCGSFCDTADHTCSFQCMVPPDSPAESCATGTQCDDTGRCVAPGGPASQAPVLSATPDALHAVPGGPAVTTQVRLSVFFPGAVAAAQSAQVRAIGRDGAEVSCNGSTFGEECVLTSWTFAFDGAKHVAGKVLRVRVEDGTPEGAGEVEVRLDSTGARIVLPIGAVAGSLDGAYEGVASWDGMPGGVAVSGVVAGDTLLLRDPSRVLAPEGQLVLDVALDKTTPITERSFQWLSTSGDDATNGIFARYRARKSTVDAETQILQVPVTVVLPGDRRDEWILHLARQPAAADGCQSDDDCEGGSVCPAALHQCVLETVWAPEPTSPRNNVDDERALRWWNAVKPLLGDGDVSTIPAGSAFATTGADMIESLLCSTTDSEVAAGRLGLTQLQWTPSTSTRSGDLTCVKGTGAGASTGSPGAVGLVTRADRRGTARSFALLELCLADLDRDTELTFDGNFGPTRGDCVNLARFVPALRLLSTGELGKRTQLGRDGRARALFARLVQQWASLHGFLASTGLSDREYDDAFAATPDEAREELESLLDTVDAGWTALLDRQVAPNLQAAATWAPTSATDAERDYRLQKRPVAYWTFNGGPNADRDLVQNIQLVPPFRTCDLLGACPIPDLCKILPGRSSLWMNYDCRGYIATLPAAPSTSDGDSLSVFFNADDNDWENPTYRGGTLVATQTIAIARSTTGATPGLAIIHPTGPGTREVVSFPSGDFGNFTDDVAPTGTSVAVVRDAANQTYTVYLRDSFTHAITGTTKPYLHPVSGALDAIAADRVMVGAGPRVSAGSWWLEFNRSYPARIDDVALFDSILSRREFTRFANARGFAEGRRDVYPVDMNLVAADTHDQTTPVGAGVLEAQVAHLDLAARLVDHMKYVAQTACETDDGSAQQAREDVDRIAARIGRTVRQSEVIEALVATDASERANDARELLRAGRDRIGRLLRTLTRCENPYGMGEDEVPLYFGSIQPNIDPKGAFFAASDHLIGLAQDRVHAADTALDEARDAWISARNSEIQQVQSDETRAIRVDELESRYGDQLAGLCGISDQTASQIMDDVATGTFDVDMCYVTPTPDCIAQTESVPITDADPGCYRGALGTSLMEMRAAYHGQQAAYQAWQAARGNAEAAERLCIFHEMDLFGCDAIDHDDLEGVTCPPGHQGTMELIEEFNDYLTERETQHSLFGNVISTLSGLLDAKKAAITYFRNPWIAYAQAGLTLVSQIGPHLQDSIEAARRNHEEVLARRAAEATIVECWSTAEQHERAIGASEEAWRQASDQFQGATIAFINHLGAASELVMEGPIAIDRETSRPSIPIAFHYWLPEAVATYRRTLESARRHTYVALRAVEHDALDSYRSPQIGKPLRSAVLGAWYPDALQAQLDVMLAQTATRTTRYGQPHASHITFDLGQKFFGLPESSADFGSALLSYVRPVYSTRGEYLGLGVRFSLVPSSDQEAPTWRCAERIWRVNVGTAGYPTGGGDSFHLKLLKRNTFASRRCRADGFESATLRPGTNLLAAAGEPGPYEPVATSSAADISVVRLDTGGALDDFRHRDDAYNASSTELSLQGLYGDYVLLFPAPALGSGLDLGALFDFNLRFDFVSVDDTPPTLRAAPRLEVEASAASIVLEQ